MSNSFATPWTVTHQFPLSIEFSRQEYCSGGPFPSPRNLPDSGIKPGSPALAGGFFTSEPTGKPLQIHIYIDTILKRPWCWERLRARGEGSDREWDGWMASPTQQKWVWANSGRWWRTGKPGRLQSLGLQRVGHSLATEQQQHWSDTVLHIFGVSKILKLILKLKKIYLYNLDMVEIFWRAGLQGMWDLSSLTRDWIWVPALEVWSLNHWIAWQVPKINLKLITF